MVVNEVQRFLKLSAKYRKHFLFTLQDLDSLLKPFGLTYTGVESGKRTLTLALAEAIAKVYGLNYCEMVAPKQNMPAIDDLPSRTRKIVLGRKLAGKKLRNDELELPKHIINVFRSGNLSTEFSSFDVWKLLPINIKGQIKSIRITDLFKKGELRDMVAETGGKRGREKLYRLK